MATLVKHWQTMLRGTRPLIEEEDVLWTCTPTPKELSDIIPAGALDAYPGAVVGAEVASEAIATSGISTSTFGKRKEVKRKVSTEDDSGTRKREETKGNG